MSPRDTVRTAHQLTITIIDCEILNYICYNRIYYRICEFWSDYLYMVV